MVGSALSGYLVGSDDDHLAARIQVGIRSIVALLAGRNSNDVNRGGSFSSRISHISSLADGGSPVLRGSCRASVRRAAVSGNLGEPAACHRSRMICNPRENRAVAIQPFTPLKNPPR